MRWKRPLLALAGIAGGLAIGLLLPRDWILVAPEVHAGHGEPSGAAYACPMFCVVLDHLPPDRRCPVCGMELGEIADRATLDDAELRMTGLRAQRLLHRPLGRTLRVVGEVDYDETRIARITARVAGWIEKVWIDTTWMPVARGARLAAIYAPELFAAQQELLASAGDEALAAAAERRLHLLGIAPEEIDALRSDRNASETLVLRSPRDGVVVERGFVEGAAVERGDLLYTVADLSRVWVQAEVFENDLAWVREGFAVRLRADGAAEEGTGRVAFIDPVLDRRTRTARVRIEVPNPLQPDGTRPLRIGQRVDAWIDADLGADGEPRVSPGPEPLAIPRSAVLSTGRRQVAYVLFTEHGRERDYDLDPEALPAPLFYELVELRLGPVAVSPDEPGEEFYPVLGARGIEVGEGFVVVTHGALLLDSQAQLSGRPSLLFPEGSRGTPAAHAGHGGGAR